MHQSKVNYFGQCRLDVLARVPYEATEILSVGCGMGRTESRLVERGAHVVGIEIDAAAASAAAKVGVEVRVGNASQECRKLESNRYDCVVLADILEHLIDAREVFEECVRALVPGGRVVISVPNFRHYSLIWALAARGEVVYRDAGILDCTHVRITTRKMIMRWCAEVGAKALACDHILHRRRDRVLSRALLGVVDEFLAKQVIVTAEKQ